MSINASGRLTAGGRIGLRIAALPVAAAVIALLWYSASAPASRNPASPGTQHALPVSTAVARPATLPVYLETLGTVQAFNTATVTARVDGQLESIAFTEGQEVKSGDKLAQIDARPFTAQLAQAEAKQAQDEAQLANAQRDLKRYSMLATVQNVSQQVLDTAQAQVAQLAAQAQGDQAAIAFARTQLSYTTLRAPFDGRTGLKLVDVGNVVHASDPAGLVVVTQLQPISVLFSVPQDALPALAAALAKGPLPATAFGRDGNTELDEGEVTLVDNRIDPATGTARLKAQFQNRDHHLWPGQFVNIRVLEATLKDVLTIPAKAISQGPEGAFTYVVKPDSTVELRPLEVGREAVGIAAIDSGLKAGETVVTSGQYRLQPGLRVQAAGVAVAKADTPGRSTGGTQ